jgi:hypothetical protein
MIATVLLAIIDWFMMALALGLEIGAMIARADAGLVSKDEQP